MTTSKQTTVPASAKKPTDHLPAKGAVADVEYNGVTYTVPVDYLDNVRVVEKLMDGLVIPVLRDMLGATQWNALLTQVEGENDGVARMTEFEPVMELFFSTVGPTAGR